MEWHQCHDVHDIRMSIGDLDTGVRQRGRIEVLEQIIDFLLGNVGANLLVSVYGELDLKTAQRGKSVDVLVFVCIYMWDRRANVERAGLQ